MWWSDDELDGIVEQIQQEYPNWSGVCVCEEQTLWEGMLGGMKFPTGNSEVFIYSLCVYMHVCVSIIAKQPRKFAGYGKRLGHH